MKEEKNFSFKNKAIIVWIWCLIVIEAIDIFNSDILSTLFLYDFHEDSKLLETLEHYKNYFTSMESLFIGMTQLYLFHH